MTFTDIPLNDTFVLPFDDNEALMLTVIIWTFFLLGIVGNVVTIVTIVHSPKLKSTWYLLIISLCVSDLLSALVSPLQLYNTTTGYSSWLLSDVLCKVCWAGDIFTSFATALHVLSFAILRLISLQWPHKFKSVISTYAKNSKARYKSLVLEKNYSDMNVQSIIKLMIFIWVVAFGFGFVPITYCVEISNRNRTVSLITARFTDCGLTEESSKWYVGYAKFSYSIFIYFPFVLIIIFSIGIGVKVNMIRKKRQSLRLANQENMRADNHKRRKERQILLQLSLIVFSFMLGYFPVTAYHFYALFAPFSTSQTHWNFIWLLGSISFVLLRLSECLNPAFYNLSSSKMRRETVVLFSLIWKRIDCAKEPVPAQSVAPATTPKTL